MTPTGVLVIALASLGTAAEAYTLEQAARPAEVPPAGYSRDVYVDSRGCAYVRASIGANVNWVPRLARDRETVICGMTPTAAVAATTATPPAPPAPPAPVALPMTTAAATLASPAAPVTAPVVATRVSAPAAAPAAISRTMTVTCPSDGSSARVRIGRSTVRVTCPAGMTQPASKVVAAADGTRTRLIVNPPAALAPIRVADAVTATPGQALGNGRVVIGGAAPGETNQAFGNGYGITTSAPPMDPVPQATYPTPMTTAPAGGVVVPTPNLPPFGNGYGLQPVEGAGRVHVPAGYRPAWDDDRLNSNRGPQTAYGDAQMAAVLDVTKVPMQPAQPVATRTVVSTKSQPTVAVPTGARYVQVGAFGMAGNAQDALTRIRSLGLGGATSRTGSGLTLVMAGPFASAAELQRALSSLRGYFPDAYPRG